MSSGAIKNPENMQFARIANALGNSDAPGTTNQGSEPLCDDNGRLIVRVAGPGGFIDGGFSLIRDPAGYTEFYSPGVIDYFLRQLTGFNINAATRFVQLHHGLVPPAPGVVPVVSILVPTNSNYSYQGAGPISFPTGLVVCSSTTGNIYTASGTADLWINIEGTP